MSAKHNTTIKTTWGAIFNNIPRTLFNEFPNILTRLEEYDELAQWESTDEDGNYTEISQWYIIPGTYDVEWLQRFAPDIAEGIHYSNTIGHYIMAVTHYGTGWNIVPATLEVPTDSPELAKIYQRTYHDDLPADIRRVMWGEEE